MPPAVKSIAMVIDPSTVSPADAAMLITRVTESGPFGAAVLLLVAVRLGMLLGSRQGQ